MTTALRTAAEILLQQMALHEQEEEEILNAYSDGARTAADPGVRFLLDLIHEDEERHRRLMTWMAAGVRCSMQQKLGPGCLPAIVGEPESRAVLLALTERYLQVERSAIRGLQDIVHTVHWIESPATTLLSQVELPKPASTADWMRHAPIRLVLQTMIDDSRKHIRILEHVKQRLARKESSNGLRNQELEPMSHP